MFFRIVRAIARCAALMSIGVLHVALGADATERSWTVRESVAVRYFVAKPSAVPPGWLSTPSASDHPIVVSHDGKHLFFVSFRGNIDCDCVTYRLEVHSVDRIQAAFLSRTIRLRSDVMVEPLRVVEAVSRRSDELEAAAIANPYWVSNEEIAFVGSNVDGFITASEVHRIFKLNIASGLVTAITDGKREVVVGLGTNFVVQGDSAIFYSKTFMPWEPLNAYPMATIRSDELWQIMEPRREVWHSFFTFRRRESRPIDITASYSAVVMAKISPDQRWAILVFAPPDVEIPKEWNQYEIPPERGYRFTLWDMQNGTSRPVFNAPAGAVTRSGRTQRKPFDAFWSADGKHVILYNTALPLAENSDERRRMSFIVDYDLAANAYTTLEPMRDARGNSAYEAGWLKQGEVLLVTRRNSKGAPSEGSVFSYQFGRWLRAQASADARPVPAGGHLPHGLTVRVEEDANTPPSVIASMKGKKVPLTATDPALIGVRIAKASSVQWQEGGVTVSGLLLLPSERSVGALPLVIQGSMPEQHAFRPDGSSLSAFAGQALVSEGFAVLQADFVGPDARSFTPDEGPSRVARIDAAVDMLASRGLIDPTRVGYVGFSRSGYLGYYAVTHPGRTKLAAAVVFDSITASYGEYTIAAGFDHAASTSVYEAQYGQGTFWENKNAWMDAPSFNVDNVNTPVLFSTTGSTSSWGILETVGAFRIARRPFEYLFFARGSHQLQRPLERAAAMQATIDWMNFWINGKEGREGPSNRFERWRRMKNEWLKTLAEEAVRTHSSIRVDR